MSFSADNTLMVPMGLKAMVMPAQDQNGGQGWDTRPMDYALINDYQSPMPQAFGNSDLSGTGTPPPTGVHLHWTLPRALTKSHSQQEVAIATEAGVPPPPGVTPYPFVPNRWMVLRIRHDGDAPTATAWVINSDEIDPGAGRTAYVDPFQATQGQVVDPIQIGVARTLDDWVALAQGPGFTKVPRHPYLTAMGPGTATFGAFTPGAGNVFSFCDPLEDDGAPIDTATLSYAVLGWFSAPTIDPVNPANPVNAQGVGWSPVDAARLPQALAQEVQGLSWIERLGWIADLGAAPAPERTLLQALISDVAWKRNAPLRKPAQFEDFVGTSQNVRVALANSSAEGVSAMIHDALVQAGKSAGEAAQTARELEALQHRALRYLDEPAGRHALADRIKRSAYASSHGGYLWEVLGVEGTTSPPLTDAQSAALAELNRKQRALDQARDVLYSMQLRLYDLWWQQQSIALGLFAPLPDRKPYHQLYADAQRNLAVPQGAALSPPVADYQTQVAAQARTVAALEAQLPPADGPESETRIADFAAGFLDPATQRLASALRPGYFAPTDPVVVVAGAGSLANPEPAYVVCRRPAAGAAEAPTDSPLPQAALAMRADAEGGAEQYARSTWQQPWAPLYLDWQITYHYAYKPGAAEGNVAIDESGHYAVDQHAWQFDGRDYRWAGGPLRDGNAITYQGRTFFSPHAKTNFARQMVQLAEDNGVEIPTGMTDAIGDWSLISQSTSGLMQILAMRDTRANVGPGEAIAADMPDALQGVPAPWLNPTPLLQDNQTGTPCFFPMRAGFASFEGLQLTDSFGRTMNLMSANHGSINKDPFLLPILPPALVPPNEARVRDKGMAVMPPRLVQPARLAFRLVDSADDTLETDLAADGNPICGWLLPNHADDSLAVYDQDGVSLGALQPFLVDGGAILRWVPAPGGDTTPGGPETPRIANIHLQALVTGVLEAEKAPERMQDLMATLDQATWTLNPGEERARGSISALMGHPVAVVRANLQLQLQGLPLANQSYQQRFHAGTDTLKFNAGGVEALSFQVRLGAVELRRDGIAGYYLGTDYGQLNAVRRPARTKTDYVLQQGGAQGNWLTVSPVATPQDGDGSMDSDGSVYVTLLVDPRGDMHATSGLLPRVRRSLPDADVTRALSNMELSLQVGPVLLDFGTVRMPLPSVQAGTWSWLHTTGTDAGDWRMDPVVDSEAGARPVAARPVLHDGWLVLRPAEKPPGAGDS